MSNGIFVGFNDEAWMFSSGGIIPAKADVCLEEPLCLYPRSLQGVHSLQALVPSLLRHEVEIALEKLDLIWDRTFAWEMFVDMMPETIQKSGQLLWTNGSSEAIASGSTHMILFQQPSFMPAATLQLHKPSSLKNTTTGKKVTTYLPILNSYPRIAPHPSKKPPDKSFLSDEAWILSKRVCTEYKGDLKPVSRSQELAVFTLEQSTSSTSSSSPTQETPNSAPCSPSTSVLTSKGSQRSSNTRHRRFLNTAEILRQSGLLDITLRTKELLGQSNTTEREIAELRQHTELLCQATSSGLSGGAAWQNVHRTMAESNCYPDLKNLKYLQSLSHLESAGQSAGAGKEAALSSDSTPKQNRACAEPHKEFTSSDTYPEEVAFMPPDSSTG